MGCEIMTFALVISKRNKIIISTIAVFDTYIRSVLESLHFFSNYLSGTKSEIYSQAFCFCYLLS